MITTEVNKFMALAPLMLPKLIDVKQCVDPDITDDSAVLYFALNEKFPIGCVMDMLDEDLDLLMLYCGVNKFNSKQYHCCFFASPKLGRCMYKININTIKDTFVEGVTVTVYDSVDIWEDELESDLRSHSQTFDFSESMTLQDLLSTFCKMNYET